MKTKAEVYQAEDKDEMGYWVCPCIKVGSYYKHFEQSKVFCKDKGAVGDVVWNVLNKKVCPECGYIFAGNGWDGIDSHWRAHHEHIMSYENAWRLLNDDKYVEVMLESAE